MALPRYAYFQGKIVPYSEARVGVMNHTLNYGTGAFGGILYLADLIIGAFR